MCACVCVGKGKGGGGEGRRGEGGVSACVHAKTINKTPKKKA